MIFKKKKPVVNRDILSAREQFGFAIHIEVSGKVLCGGTSILDGQYPTSVEEVIGTAPNQHSGWYWCSKCATELTGKPVSFFHEWHKKNK